MPAMLVCGKSYVDAKLTAILEASTVLICATYDMVRSSVNCEA